MEESKRQKQVARLVQEELTTLFQKEGWTIIEGGMLSIAQVKMTPDLLEARVYFSFLKIKNPKNVIHHITEKKSTIRHYLGNQLRHQLRRIPELMFFKDDTLEEAYRLEAIFKELEQEGEEKDSKKDK